MSETSNVYDIQDAKPRKIAKLSDGYTTTSKSIVRKILTGNYTKRQHIIIRAVELLTYGVRDDDESASHHSWRNRKTSRITAQMLSDETGLSIQDASKTLNTLLRLNVLIRTGDNRLGEIGFNTNVDEWISNETDGRKNNKFAANSDLNTNSTNSDLNTNTTPPSNSDLMPNTSCDLITNKKSGSLYNIKYINKTRAHACSSLKDDCQEVNKKNVVEPEIQIAPQPTEQQSISAPAKPAPETKKPTRAADWLKHHVERGMELQKKGKTWTDLPKNIKIASVFYFYNKIFDRTISPFANNGDLGGSGRNCEYHINRGATLGDFKTLFSYAAAMIADGGGDPKKQNSWSYRREIGTLLRRRGPEGGPGFEDYCSEAQEWVNAAREAENG